MDGKEFLKAVDLVVKEKHIDKEIIYEAMRNALTSAYKKNAKSKNNNVKVLINENNGDIKVYSYLTVVQDDKMTKEEYEDALFERYADDDDLDTEISEKSLKKKKKLRKRMKKKKRLVSLIQELRLNLVMLES